MSAAQLGAAAVDVDGQAHDRARPRAIAIWPLWLIASPAAVAIWSGWVGLGTMCGFGLVHPLPGIWPSARLNTAITLPVGVEAYAAYALRAWLSPDVAGPARTFARRSALGALTFGMAGQVVYHLLAAAHAARAPWPVVMLVSCLPVVSLAFGAALAHLLRAQPNRARATQPGAAHVGAAQDPAPVRAAPREPERPAEPVAAAVAPEPPARAGSGAPRAAEPAPARTVSARPTAQPARPSPAVPPPVSDRAGTEHARQAYRASVAAGAPLSARALAERHGISRRQAGNIVAGAARPALSVVKDRP